jgi:membrane protease YdiL (CAAX protease family)
MASLIRKRPLLTFFVLAYVFSWLMIALIPVSFAFALLALFGPALAAVIVSYLTEGSGGVGSLFAQLKIWRVGAVPYVLAIGVPLLVAVGAQVIHAIAFGGQIGVPSGTELPLIAVLAVLVIGEEIGWRGFALPRLQQKFSSVFTSLILGVAWAAWHLANGTIPGLQHYWTGFPAFLLFVVGQTFFFTWLWNRSGGSLLLAWLLHASINVSLALFSFGDQVQQWWLGGAIFGVLAVLRVLAPGAAWYPAAREPQSSA